MVLVNILVGGTSSSDSTLANSHDFWLEGGLANPEIRMKKVENL